MAKKKIVSVDLKALPHNGEGRPDLQFPDPVTGEMIGGQVAAMRMSMRYRHTVMPWARRQGKTKFRPFVIQNEATITPGMYYCGIAYPDHTTAAKVAMNFKDSWSGMVKGFKINDKDQDRWIDLHPLAPPPRDPPAWFTEPMKAMWDQCRGGNANTGSRIYFWSTTHPFYRKIQGFPHHFNRVDWDEAQEVHPEAYGIVRPMIRDVLGHETFSGTPWHTGIGNVQFETWWNIAGDPESLGWFRMRIPDGTNPHVPRVTKAEMKGMTRQQIRQTLYAEFLTGEGAVFSNLDEVFILKALDPESTHLNWVKQLRSQWSMPTMEWWVHQPTPLPGHIYAVSIDWARSPKGDYSVLTVWDMTSLKQVAVFRWRGENFPSQMEVVLAVQAWYGAKQCHSDENGMGRPMSDFMAVRHAVGFVGHSFGKNKPDYVRRGQILFQDADIQMIDFPEQRHEFKSFSAFESEGLGSEKQIKYCAPEGGHDDFVASFLHLAPTMTIVGRQASSQELVEAKPMFDEESGLTTMEKFLEGEAMPWENHEKSPEDSWASVVLPPKYQR